VPSRVEIQCECAFTYMNAVFRRKPDRRVPVDEVDAGMIHNTGGALRSVKDEARVVPDDSDMHLGVSDPPKTRLRTELKGWPRGSLTPRPWPWSAAAAARTAKPAAQSAAGARPEAADQQEHRASIVLQKATRRAVPRTTDVSGRGERCSRVSVPPPRSPFSRPDTRNQGERRRPVTVRLMLLRRILAPVTRQQSDARPWLVDRQERASCEVVAVRFECLGDDADSGIREQV
jgi:Ni/Co efflux regulator RcnB